MSKGAMWPVISGPRTGQWRPRQRRKSWPLPTRRSGRICHLGFRPLFSDADRSTCAIPQGKRRPFDGPQNSHCSPSGTWCGWDDAEKAGFVDTVPVLTPAAVLPMLFLMGCDRHGPKRRSRSRDKQVQPSDTAPPPDTPSTMDHDGRTMVERSSPARRRRLRTGHWPPRHDGKPQSAAYEAVPSSSPRGVPEHRDNRTSDHTMRWPETLGPRIPRRRHRRHRTSTRS